MMTPPGAQVLEPEPVSQVFGQSAVQLPSTSSVEVADVPSGNAQVIAVTSAPEKVSLLRADSAFYTHQVIAAA